MVIWPSDPPSLVVMMMISWEEIEKTEWTWWSKQKKRRRPHDDHHHRSRSRWSSFSLSFDESFHCRLLVISLLFFCLTWFLIQKAWKSLEIESECHVSFTQLSLWLNIVHVSRGTSHICMSTGTWLLLIVLLQTHSAMHFTLHLFLALLLLYFVV